MDPAPVPEFQQKAQRLREKLQQEQHFFDGTDLFHILDALAQNVDIQPPDLEQASQQLAGVIESISQSVPQVEGMDQVVESLGDLLGDLLGALGDIGS